MPRASERVDLTKMPSRPGELHPEPLTDPNLTLSRHPARATARRLPPYEGKISCESFELAGCGDAIRCGRRGMKTAQWFSDTAVFVASDRNGSANTCASTRCPRGRVSQGVLVHQWAILFLHVLVQEENRYVRSLPGMSIILLS
jgi:hypothetical protein